MTDTTLRPTDAGSVGEPAAPGSAVDTPTSRRSLAPLSRRTVLKTVALGALSSMLPGCYEYSSTPGAASPTPAEPTTPGTVETPPATATGTPDGHETYDVAFAQCSFHVEFGCTVFRIRPSRPAFEYYLTLQYRDRETGQRVPCIVGPLTGPVEDEFGDTGLVLVEVVLDVPLEGTVAFHIPRRCVDYDGPLLDQRAPRAA